MGGGRRVYSNAGAADDLRRRHPLELQRGMQRPSAWALRNRLGYSQLNCPLSAQELHQPRKFVRDRQPMVSSVILQQESQPFSGSFDSFAVDGQPKVIVLFH
jgi:hypothetical protein